MTFYSVSHNMQLFFFPPTLNFLVAFIGLLLWRRWPVTGKSLVFFAFVSLWLLCTPIVAWQLIHSLQNQYPSLQTSRLTAPTHTTAIVVLGGGIEKAPEYENHLTVSNATLDRLQYAAYLYDKTHLPIIVSGGKSDGESYTAADLMAETLNNYFKITAQWKEDKSINTADESRFLMPLFKKNKIDTIYLITNAWHMPRSVYAFKQAGVKIIPAPTGYVMQQYKPSLLNYLPSSEGLSTNIIAIHEYIGLLWYRIRST